MPITFPPNTMSGTENLNLTEKSEATCSKENDKAIKKRHRFIEQTFGLCGRRRWWDVSREQHRNMYII